nr:GntR family transcriptional regulator [Kribbella italica]
MDQKEPGDRLPAERQLAADFGVARMTLRNALDRLEAEGRVHRIPKQGAFVGQHKLTHGLTVSSFTEEMLALGKRPSSRTLGMDVRYAGETLATKLRIGPDERVWRISRLRLADEIPLTLETVYVPQTIAPDLTREDLQDQSWYQLLAERYGRRITSGVQTIEPTVTDEEESILLDVPLRSAAFLFVRTCEDQSGRPVEHVRATTRGDLYRIQCQLTLGQPGLDQTPWS